MAPGVRRRRPRRRGRGRRHRSRRRDRRPPRPARPRRPAARRRLAGPAPTRRAAAPSARRAVERARSRVATARTGAVTRHEREPSITASFAASASRSATAASHRRIVAQQRRAPARERALRGRAAHPRAPLARQPRDLLQHLEVPHPLRGRAGERLQVERHRERGELAEHAQHVEHRHRREALPAAAAVVRAARVLPADAQRLADDGLVLDPHEPVEPGRAAADVGDLGAPPCSTGGRTTRGCRRAAPSRSRSRRRRGSVGRAARARARPPRARCRSRTPTARSAPCSPSAGSFSTTTSRLPIAAAAPRSRASVASASATSSGRRSKPRMSTSVVASGCWSAAHHESAPPLRNVATPSAPGAAGRAAAASTATGSSGGKPNGQSRDQRRWIAWYSCCVRSARVLTGASSRSVPPVSMAGISAKGRTASVAGVTSASVRSHTSAVRPPMSAEKLSEPGAATTSRTLCSGSAIARRSLPAAAWDDPPPMPADDLTALLADLVAIDSVNPSLVPGGAGEGAAAAFVERWARSHGLEAERLEATPGRPSVLVRARGAGGGRTLLLCGHLDTVGVDGMREPLTPAHRRRPPVRPRRLRHEGGRRRGARRRPRRGRPGPRRRRRRRRGGRRGAREPRRAGGRAPPSARTPRS